jgi:allophanate hydrolase subunit 2
VLPLAENCSKERFATLKRKSGTTVRWSAPPLTLPDREPIVVHAIEGQHFASFDATAQRAFFDTVWRVAPESNRMGFRLDGAPLVRADSEILSGPTCLGSVQVPPSGAPIALMADHQTTGGYPHIAEIVSADVPRLAQLAPGGTVHFARCSLEMAAELRRDMKERLDGALRGIGWAYGS